MAVKITYAKKADIPSDFADSATLVDEKDEAKGYEVTVDLASKVTEFRDNNIELSKKIEAADGVTTSLAELFPDTEDGTEYDFAGLQEELKALREVNTQVEDGKLTKTGDIDKAVDKRVNLLTTKYEKDVVAFQEKVANLNKIVETKEAQIRSNILNTAINSLMQNEKIGFEPTAAEAIANKAASVFTVNDKGGLDAKDGDGNTLWGEDGQTTLTPIEWASDEHLRKSNPWMYRPSVGAGDTFSSNSGGVSTSDLSKMTQKELWAAAAKESENRRH